MPDWANSGVAALVILGMAIGLFGLFIPFFPGVIVIWLSILGYGVVHGFTIWSGILFGVITVLMLASTVVDNVLMGANARQQGTSWLAIAVGTVSMLVASVLW